MKKKNKKNTTNSQGHTDAVTSLQLNPFRKNFLVSGSADTSIKVWDLNTCKPAWGVVPDDGARVEIVKWHPTKEHMVLSVSENKQISLWDVRQGNKVGSVRLDKQPEGVAWDCWGEERLWLGFEDGSMGEIDSTKGLGLTFDIKIAPKNVTSLSTCPGVKGVLASTS